MCFVAGLVDPVTGGGCIGRRVSHAGCNCLHRRSRFCKAGGLTLSTLREIIGGLADLSSAGIDHSA